MYDREKILFEHDMQSKVNGLNFQRERIFNIPHKELWEKKVSPIHDVDFYVILLRRLYRKIEDVSKHDSRVANLKGKHKELFNKVKIRDHFEHGVDIDDFFPTPIFSLPKGIISAPEGTSIKISTSLMNNVIVSGEFMWDLNTDHESFILVTKDFVDLYPFN